MSSDRTASRRGGGLLWLAPALLLLLLFAGALGALGAWSVREFVPGSLQPGGLTTANFRQIAQPHYLRTIADTVWLSVWTTLGTLLLAYPIAHALARTRSRALRTALLVATLAPFLTGAVVRAYAWMLVLGMSGFVNSLLLSLGVVAEPVRLLFTPTGVVIGMVHFSLPVMTLMIAAALAHVDPTLERAAASLGASPPRVFARVTLPLALPGVVGGAVVVFAWTFSAFPIPALLGGGRVKMIANVMADLAVDSFNWPGGSAFALVALAVTVLLVGVVAGAAQRLVAAWTGGTGARA